ncbi:MAG: hypothetical protein NUV50_09565 [Rhodospirillales bacterium]|nr:hypothetical protein [Rhodospirillales bacterium]
MNHATPTWWKSPRRINVIVDNPSWIVPYAHELVDRLNQSGDQALFCENIDAVQSGAVAFYLGCTTITPPDVLARNQRNLVVHESNLPQGRGFSPLSWLILDGNNSIPICLLEATNNVDAGNVVYRDTIEFEGHELNAELRHRQGEATLSLCLKYMSSDAPPVAVPQAGEPTYYRRRKPVDSKLNPDQSIREQFNLLRIVNNERYPAFFEIDGIQYTLKITKVS